MTDRVFQYDEYMLQRCATSTVAKYVVQSDDDPNNDSRIEINERYSDDNAADINDDQYCEILLRQYMDHYQREPHQQPSEPLVHISRSNTFLNTTNDKNYYYHVGSRMRYFIRNVITIHRHNSKPNQRFHRLRLNRFSDQDLRNTEKIFPSHTDSATTSSRDYEKYDNPSNISNNQNSRRLHQISFDTQHRSMESMKVVPIVHLSSFDEIQQLGMEWYHQRTDRTAGDGRRRSRHHGFVKNINHYTKRKTDHIQFDLYPSKLRLPTDDMISDDDNHQHSSPTNNSRPFYKSGVLQNSEMDGALVEIGRNKKRYSTRKEHDDDMFATHINWATTNNPDGVSIVHDPIDQGSCGSCWALSATGSIEANAARRNAYSAYQGMIDKLKQSTTATMLEIYHNATLVAQRVERQSIDRLNLSIQELIDCDTAVDQGCVGGNPLLAFYFIHKYGLASSDQYPYVGMKGKCHKRSANAPIATVESWGILPPNSERHMELVLRYIGPIAVGFNGGDPTFLSYSGGIYYNQNCHHRSNHALLVVGYGEEESIDDNGNNVNVPYWIARNSWGTGWGENGYVRIYRGKGIKGEPGQCGIACSPSVALGGTLLLLEDVQQEIFPISDMDHVNDNSSVNHLRSSDINNPIEANDSSHPLEIVVPYTTLEKMCLRLGHKLDNNSRCGIIADYVATHRAMIFGVVGVLATLLVVVWPLTWDCRRRAHRRRMRKLQQQQQQLQQLEWENDGLTEIQPDETSTLIVPNGVADITYGTSTNRARERV